MKEEGEEDKKQEEKERAQEEEEEKKRLLMYMGVREAYFTPSRKSEADSENVSLNFE